MNKRGSDWCLPPELRWVLIVSFAPMCIGISLGLLAAWTYATDVRALFGVGLGAGAIGVVTLFVARLPLYKQHRFWTYGPKQLDRKHRRKFAASLDGLARGARFLNFWVQSRVSAEIPRVESPITAVRASIVAEAKKRKK
jgi:hypothetical protein